MTMVMVMTMMIFLNYLRSVSFYLESRKSLIVLKHSLKMSILSLAAHWNHLGNFKTH